MKSAAALAVVLAVSAARAAEPRPGETPGIVEQDGVPVSIRTPACTANNFKALEVVLPNVLMHALKHHSSPEARDAAAFLESHKTFSLVIGVQKADAEAYWPRPVIEEPRINMQYYRWRKQFRINHSAFHTEGRDERTFLADRDALKRLAEEAAGSFIHEISHAREDEGWAGRLPHFMDDELLAAYREMRFVLDALEQEPDFLKLREAYALQKEVVALVERLKASSDEAARSRLRELAPAYRRLVTAERLDLLRRLNSLKRSNRAFERGFAAGYSPSVPSLDSDPKRERAVEERFLPALEQNLAAVEAKLAVLDPASPAAERERDRKAEALELLEGTRQALEFWKRPERIRAARRRYGELLGAMRREMDERRARSGPLDGFGAARAETLAVRFDLGT